MRHARLWFAGPAQGSDPKLTRDHTGLGCELARIRKEQAGDAPPKAAVAERLLCEARGKAKVLAVSARRIPLAGRSFTPEAGSPGAL